MKTLTTSELRNDIFNIAKAVTTKNDIVRVAHKSGDFVLLSAEIFEGIEETMLLASNPNFATSIAEARQEIEAGETVSLTDLKANEIQD